MGTTQNMMFLLGAALLFITLASVTGYCSPNPCRNGGTCVEMSHHDHHHQGHNHDHDHAHHDHDHAHDDHDHAHDDHDNAHHHHDHAHNHHGHAHHHHDHAHHTRPYHCDCEPGFRGQHCQFISRGYRHRHRRN